MTRSTFLSGALASAFASTGCISPGRIVGACDDLAVKLRVGALASPRVDGHSSVAALVEALAFLRDREVDAIVVAGDLTENGYVPQLRLFADAWNEVFRGAFPLRDGAPRTGPVPVLVAGERDMTGWRVNPGEEAPDSAIAADPARAWRETFGLEWVPVFRTFVRGHRFIGIHHLDERGPDRAALAKELESLDDDERAGRRIFFTVQYPVPYGTCCRNAGWDCTDRGQTHRLLRKFRSAVALSGRARTPLTDESAIWSGGFVSANVSSLAPLFTAPDRENGRSPLDSASGRGPDAIPARHLLVARVYSSSIRFERFDPERRERVAEDLAFSTRGRADGREEAIPRFWNDTIVSVIRGNRRGVGAKVGAAEYAVVFPAVQARHTGTRAYDYEVKAIPVAPLPGSSMPAVIAKSVYSPAHLLAERRETAPVRCLFAKDELAGASRWRFEVTPRNAFGRCGASRSSGVVAIGR